MDNFMDDEKKSEFDMLSSSAPNHNRKMLPFGLLQLGAMETNPELENHAFETKVNESGTSSNSSTNLDVLNNLGKISASLFSILKQAGIEDLKEFDGWNFNNLIQYRGIGYVRATQLYSLCKQNGISINGFYPSFDTPSQYDINLDVYGNTIDYSHLFAGRFTRSTPNSFNNTCINGPIEENAEVMYLLFLRIVNQNLTRFCDSISKISLEMLPDDNSSFNRDIFRTTEAIYKVIDDLKYSLHYTEKYIRNNYITGFDNIRTEVDESLDKLLENYNSTHDSK